MAEKTTREMYKKVSTWKTWKTWVYIYQENTFLSFTKFRI